MLEIVWVTVGQTPRTVVVIPDNVRITGVIT
jgi:hypothetical protein